MIYTFQNLRIVMLSAGNRLAVACRQVNCSNVYCTSIVLPFYLFHCCRSDAGHISHRCVVSCTTAIFLHIILLLTFFLHFHLPLLFLDIYLDNPPILAVVFLVFYHLHCVYLSPLLGNRRFATITKSSACMIFLGASVVLIFLRMSSLTKMNSNCISAHPCLKPTLTGNSPNIPDSILLFLSL